MKRLEPETPYPIHRRPQGGPPWRDRGPAGDTAAPTRISLVAPGMGDRAALRRVAAHLHDLPGVVAVQIDLTSRTIRIEGDVDPTAARRAVRRAGYDVT